MPKEITISLRATEETKEMIADIRDYWKNEKHAPGELTDSEVIRAAIYTMWLDTVAEKGHIILERSIKKQE